MSKIDRLLCHVLPRACLMALVAQGRLVELLVARRDKPSPVDAIFLGRVERVMAELDAAFVDIGIGRSGFLRAEDRAGIDGWPAPGAPVLVQVRSDDESSGKGPRLTMNVAVAGRYLVYHPMGSGIGFSRRIESEAQRDRLARHLGRLFEGGVVVRTAAATADPAALRAEALEIMERWDRLRRQALGVPPPADISARVPGERDPILRVLRDHGGELKEVILDDRGAAQALHQEAERRREGFRVQWHDSTPLFDIDDVSGQIDTALASRIELASGVELLFEVGETLTAIDVDSATAGGRQGQAPRRAVDVNVEAAPAIAQQLRLRNLAGAILIDFVTMRSSYDRDKVQAALAEALADDPVPTQLYGFTRLGLFELTRARRGASLARQLEALEASEGA